MSKEVVIIGGSFAGIGAAKAILSNNGSLKVNVTVIAPSKFAYFCVATPRLLIETNKIDQALFDITESLKIASQSSVHNATHVQGTAESVDLEKKVVYLKDGSVVKYDNLIIATGTKYDHPAFKLDDVSDHTSVVSGIKDLSLAVKNSETIAIIGGGPTGVETAGEIGFEYGGKKKVTLYTGSDGPLPPLKDSIRATATSKLESYGVKVVNNEKVVSIEDSVITTDRGTTKKFDLVIPAYSKSANTSFLSNYGDILDAKGHILTDKYLRLKDYPDVLVFGDVLAQGIQSIIDLNYNQKPALLKSIDLQIFGIQSELTPYKTGGAPTMMVPISRNGGVGSAFGFTFPNFLVRLVKAKTFMIGKAKENF